METQPLTLDRLPSRDEVINALESAGIERSRIDQIFEGIIEYYRGELENGFDINERMRFNAVSALSSFYEGRYTTTQVVDILWYTFIGGHVKEWVNKHYPDDISKAKIDVLAYSYNQYGFGSVFSGYALGSKQRLWAIQRILKNLEEFNENSLRKADRLDLSHGLLDIAIKNIGYRSIAEEIMAETSLVLSYERKYFERFSSRIQTGIIFVEPQGGKDLRQIRLELIAVLKVKLEEEQKRWEAQTDNESASSPVTNSRLPWQSDRFLEIKKDFQGTQHEGREIVGNSKAMTDFFEKIDSLIAILEPNDSILIRGRTRTGKDLIWRLIQQLGVVQQIGIDGGFYIVDIRRLSRMSADQVNAELFGARGEKGVLTKAPNETMVLDGIEHISPAVQDMLLRAIDSDSAETRAGKLVIALQNDQFPDHEIIPDFMNRFTHILDIPDLEDRPGDIALIYEYYNYKKSKEMDTRLKKIGRTFPWKPLSLEAGFALEHDDNGYYKERQVQTIINLVNRVLKARVTANTDGHLTTIDELHAAGLPSEVYAHDREGSTPDALTDVNGVKIRLGTRPWYKTTSQYLDVVHGQRPFFEQIPHNDSVLVELRSKAVLGEEVSRQLKIMNAWLASYSSNILQGRFTWEESHINNIRLEFNQEEPNGEYRITIIITTADSTEIKEELVVSMEGHGLSLFVALMSKLFGQSLDVENHDIAYLIKLYQYIFDKNTDGFNFKGSQIYNFLVDWKIPLSLTYDTDKSFVGNLDDFSRQQNGTDQVISSFNFAEDGVTGSSPVSIEKGETGSSPVRNRGEGLMSMIDERRATSDEIGGIDAESSASSPASSSPVHDGGIRTFGARDILLHPYGVGALGWGGKWPLDHPNYRNPSQEDINAMMMAAYKSVEHREGVRVMIDTAKAYDSEEFGSSEEKIGIFLKAHPGLRHKFYVATKFGINTLWLPGGGYSLPEHSMDTLEESFARSQDRLGKVDLLYIHFSSEMTEQELNLLRGDKEIVKAMQALRDHGDIEEIGVTISKEDIFQMAHGEGLLDDFDILQMYATTFLNNQELVHELEAGGKGIVLNSSIRKPGEQGKSVEEIIDEVFGKEGNHVLLVGTTNPAHLEENVRRAEAATSSSPVRDRGEGLSSTSDERRATSDEIGGIDMNEINVDRQGGGVTIQFDPIEIQSIIDRGITGFTPVIINITPLPSVLPLLGLAPKEEEEEEYQLSQLN